MWTDNDELEYEVNRTKFQSGVGCLIVGFILLVVIIVSAMSLTSKAYDKLTEDTELVESKSPDQNHIIKVIVKGTLTFNDPTVVISYKNNKMERKINNDRKSLNPSDVSISWKNNEEATILLFGEKQSSEVVEFKLPNKGSESTPFQVVQSELGLFPFQKSESPNHVNIVELRKYTYSKGMGRFYDEVPIEVYYGKIGDNLQRYGEFEGGNPNNKNSFQILWKDDQHVSIDARAYNKSMEIEFK
ncbi:hypothetical protein [Neobacillus sp.]|uniref:hypothetical protein n=1 Tax=Neobacillus sp. TaxID=2675273 RepID=UPI00289932F5|nr:hypothetical protein [Neobacillus sp.]